MQHKVSKVIIEHYSTRHCNTVSEGENGTINRMYLQKGNSIMKMNDYETVQGNSGYVTRSPKIERSPGVVPDSEMPKSTKGFTAFKVRVNEQKHKPKTISIPVTVIKREHEPKPEYVKITYLDSDN